ncbi:MAG: ATP-binding protein [Bacteroidales bacterium]|nr:ATP-binding protein [Candidatus Cacconaster merdequi]
MKQRFEPIEGRNAEIIECVMNCPEVLSLPDDLQFKVRLCTEEVEENILGYSGSKWVELLVENDGSKLLIQFSDGGVKFNPLAKDDPDIDAPLEERQIGGLGIFLCKQMMDGLEYAYTDGCNILRMIKNL